MTPSAFGQAARLSPKALRLYAERGLLVPAAVDPATGYRTYAPAQLARARAIGVLRALDLSLDDVGALLDAPSPEAVAALTARVEERAAQQRRVLSYVPRLLGLEAPVDHPVTLVDLPDAAVLRRTGAVSIDRLEPVVRAAVADLAARAEPAGAPYTRFLSPVDDERDGEVEVCLPVAAGTPGAVVAPGGPHAVARADGDDARYPAVLAVYDAVAAWASAQGRALAGPPREVHPPDEDRLEVAWPVAPPVEA